MRNNGYIYAIEARDGKVKIGRSCNPQKRVQAIKTISGNSEERSFICEIECDCVSSEKILHTLFSQHRFDGEWFSAPFGDIVDEINRVCSNNQQKALKANNEKVPLPASIDYDAFQLASMSFMESNPVFVVCDAFNRFKGVIHDTELLRFCNLAAELNDDKFEDMTDLEYFVKASSLTGE